MGGSKDFINRFNFSFPLVVVFLGVYAGELNAEAYAAHCQMAKAGRAPTPTPASSDDKKQKNIINVKKITTPA